MSYEHQFGDALQFILGSKPARHMLLVFHKVARPARIGELRYVMKEYDSPDFDRALRELTQHLLVVVHISGYGSKVSCSDPCITDAGVQMAEIILCAEKTILETNNVPLELREAAAKVMNPTRE